jgi:uncharacterized membrane protein YfcA
MGMLIGFIIALLVGVTGVGGGSLTVPVLTLFLGVPTAQAVGVALLFVTVTKMIAVPVYVYRRQIDYSVLKRLLVGGLPGVIIGSLALSRINSARLQPLVLAAVGSTIAVMALLSLWKLRHNAPPRPATPRLHLLPRFAAPIGFEVGFSSAGAGALGSLLLMYTTTLSTGTIVGTDLLFGLVISAVGGGLHLASGNINVPLLSQLCLGGIAGAMLGAQLGSRVPSRPLRAALSAVLVFLGGQLFWKGVESLAR